MNSHHIASLWLLLSVSVAGADETLRWKETVTQLTASIAKAPQTVDLYSQRGDVRFFLGEFAPAVADYDQMVALEPELDAGHWRRGIALFYAGDYETGRRPV